MSGIMEKDLLGRGRGLKARTKWRGENNRFNVNNKPTLERLLSWEPFLSALSE